MLSICIPVYNFNLTTTLHQLLQQSEEVDHAVEIIVIDDDSDLPFKEAHRIIQHANFRYTENKSNRGRSAIRNQLAKKAKFNHLLYLDGDVGIIRDHFIRDYIKAIALHPMAVINGGRVYPPHSPGPNQNLRWEYGITYESKTAAERSKTTYASFMTNNFATPKAVIEAIPFDERIAQYGHEDTLFGWELQQRKIQLIHIDNPILNIDIETDSVFMDKTDESIISLAQICKMYTTTSLPNSIRLYRVTKNIKWFFKLPFIHSWTEKHCRKLRKKLIDGKTDLNLFQSYKILKFCITS